MQITASVLESVAPSPGCDRGEPSRACASVRVAPEDGNLLSEQPACDIPADSLDPGFCWILRREARKSCWGKALAVNSEGVQGETLSLFWS